MGLFTLLARCFAPRCRRDSFRSLNAAPLSPRRLERRRVLDASAASLLLAPIGASSDFVQVGDLGNPTPSDSPATTENNSVVDDGNGQGNTPPSNIQIFPLGEVYENNVARLLLVFDDPDQQDTHTVEIDWGDGTAVETIQLDAGTRFLATSHKYLDDNPTGTAVDVNQVSVKIVDSQGGSTTASAPITVKNVAPSNVQVAPLGMIDENGVARLALVFDDPGIQDTFTVEIDWDDGTAVETIQLDAGTRFLATTHQYLDDNPTGTPSDVYNVQVKIIDDDGGQITASAPITVKNVAPTLSLVGDQIIDEGSLLDLTGANLGSFSDPGTLDTYTATILWGDGTPAEAVTVNSLGGSGTLDGASHVFADNGVYTVMVQLTDDDDGMASSSFQVVVGNVDPALITLTGTDIDRFGRTSVTGVFNDPGFDNPQATPATVESFIIEIDWGDGNVQQVFVGGPTPSGFTIVHNYSGPPDPLNPAADVEIRARLLDDDGGLDTDSVFVSNPGKGTDPVRIDTTPQVPRLVFPQRVQSDLFFEVTTAQEESLQAADLRASVGDTKATTDRFLQLRYFKADGQLSEGFRLKSQVLSDLPALFRKLPDNHWAIFLVRTETNTHRLVIEVYVRNGKVIDPGDDSEGTRDRPPTDESSRQPGSSRQPVEELELLDRSDTDPAAENVSTSSLLPNERPVRPIWGPAAAGLIATTWAQQVDRAIAQAGPQQWRRLRRDGPIRQKNRE